MQILIIEDDASIRDMLSECLGDEGYSVVTACDGQQGLNMLRASASAPDLILLDLAMPVMSGWTLLDVLQQDPLLAPIPLVVLSADSRVAKQPIIGARTPVVAKPVDLDDLLGVVARYAGRG